MLGNYFQACCTFETPSNDSGDVLSPEPLDGAFIKRQLAKDVLQRRRLQDLPRPLDAPSGRNRHASSSSSSSVPLHHSTEKDGHAEEVIGKLPQDIAMSRHQRASRTKALCQEAWHQVDGLKFGYIDMHKAELGLAFVFQQLGDIPVPEGYWYVQVFQNFDTKGQGRLYFEGFKEIVEQWDTYCLARLSILELEVASSGDRGYSAYSNNILRQPDKLSPFGCSDDISDIVDSLQEASELLQDSAQPSASSTGQRDAAESVQSQADLQRSSHIKAQDQAQTPRRRRRVAGDRRYRSLSPNYGGSREGRRVAAAEVVQEVMFPTYVGRLAILDEYEFLGIIGQGACGKVMAVQHRHTQQVRACKVAAVRREQERELIDTEITLLKSLNHPNIMNLHEVFFESSEHPGGERDIYIVTELCRGGDLTSRIAYHYEWLKRPMTEGHVAYMMRQILSATRYCHSLGVIHRDVKPQNILFVNQSSGSPIKMIDFGLANFTEHIRQSAIVQEVPRRGALGKLAKMLPAVGGKELLPRHVRKQIMQRAGTPHYMAPELIAGRYDEKADLFSIGAMFCELLTGVHPFFIHGVDDEVSAKAKIASREPVVFPCEALPDHKVSRAARDLCLALLRKEPRKRLGASQALAHPWFRENSKSTPFGQAECLSTSIFDGLCNYKAHNKLKRAVLQLLAVDLSEGQIEEPRGRFMALNTQGDGLLSPEELEEGARRVGYELTHPELQQIIAALDSSGSGRIGYKEFVAALVEGGSGFNEQQLSECFIKLDTRGAGQITYEDIRNVLCSSDDRPGITRSEWEEIVPRSNKAEAALNFDAFLHLMQPGNTRNQAASPTQLLELAADLLSEPGSQSP